MKEFVVVSESEFFELFTAESYSWRQTAPDLDWIESHLTFVWSNSTAQTVGYRRTSSYGSPNEYKVLQEMLDN